MNKQIMFTHHKETSKISEKYFFKTASDLWFWFIHGPVYTGFTNDCTCSCKSNYHTIMTMMAPQFTQVLQYYLHVYNVNMAIIKVNKRAFPC